MPSLFTRPGQRKRRRSLGPLTLRDFGGGWSTIDDDELLNPRFSVALENMHINADKSVELRFGSFLFSDIQAVVSGDVIDHTYFVDRLVLVTDEGEVATVDSVGTAAVIWNETIANALPGGPNGWSNGLTICDFVPFKEKLIIHNGIDKPIEIDNTYNVTYLQDLATGSNVNVPIGKFGCVVSNYHVVGGISITPTELIVSSVGTSGTFIGDPAPNDSIVIDVGAFAPSDTEEIRGIAGFRNSLLVFFRGNTLLIELGHYESSVHVPQFSDTLPHFGLLGHRCIVPIENDLLFATQDGVASAKRNLLAGLIESEHVSQLITTNKNIPEGPSYMSIFRTLTDVQQKEQCFAVHNELDGSMMFFSPASEFCVVYTFNTELRTKGFSLYTGWDWTSACQTAQGRVFFAKGTKVYQMGNNVFPGEYVYADYIDDPDAAGVPIAFNWELPWVDFNNPETTKKINNIKIATKGTASFNVEAFADLLFRDEDGTETHDPQVEMTFTGHQDATATRRSNDPRLYRFPFKFKQMKLRFSGMSAIDKKIQFSKITMLQASGSFFRP